MQSLAIKILDVFVYKFQNQLSSDGYKDFTPTN